MVSTTSKSGSGTGVEIGAEVAVGDGSTKAATSGMLVGGTSVGGTGVEVGSLVGCGVVVGDLVGVGDGVGLVVGPIVDVAVASCVGVWVGPWSSGSGVDVGTGAAEMVTAPPST